MFKIANARSVVVDVPLPKLYKPPAVGAVVTEEKLETVVADVLVAQSEPNLKPVGKVAVALVPIPSKFSVKAVPTEVMLICAFVSFTKNNDTIASVSNRKWHFIIF